LAAGGSVLPAGDIIGPTPDQMAFDAAGDLWMSGPGADAVYGYSPSALAQGTTATSPAPSWQLTGPNPDFGFPEGVAVLVPPTVSSVTPQAGHPGTAVTVHGTGFTSGATVRFNGTPATTVVDVSPFTLTAKVPPGARTVTVTVTTAGGTSNGAAFTYAATGYDMVGEDGGVFVFDAPGQSGGFYGSLPGLGVVPNTPVVGIVPTKNDDGYFLVATDGGVFSFGNAPFLGSLPGIGVTPTTTIVGIVATNTDKGYLLVGADGGVFAFGTAPFLGSLPSRGITVGDGVFGIAATPSGDGYWVVTFTGTVYAFGTAQAFPNNLPSQATVFITNIAGTPTGAGYWLVGIQGAVYPFGNAKGYGTLPKLKVTPSLPVIAIVPTSGTTGYWLIGLDGGIYAFGTAPFYGSLPGLGVRVTDIVGAVPN
jgi:hypothetical protein